MAIKRLFRPPPPKKKKKKRAIGERKQKVKNWPFLKQFTPSGEFLGPFLAIFSQTLASRGLHYYGMILLYIWVRFKHFPPLIDFFSLKSPSPHM